MPTQVLDDVLISNSVFRNCTLPAGSVGDREMEAGADVDPTKLRHRRILTVGQKNGAANVAQREGLSVLHGSTGTLVACYARNITAAGGGDSTTVQIKVNGSNVLSSALVLDAAAATATQSTVSFTATAMTAGAVIDVDITVSGATPGQGVSVTLVFDEDPT